ncbi:MAG: S-adenosylmethionine decarboxylase [Clostridiales bacterium]|jgi:S-adenosylmethionine decarboxylase|nr:S-adenosylmethionine decarboxylase [Clostridiales bacterium]MDN5281183.1 S-adenosylmethionine decarboxylase [Candidatus Ozemobacter sp.]
MKTMPNSIHIIADFSVCPVELLKSGEKGGQILEQTVQESGLNCILVRYHQFSPDGYTAAALLTESHITLHSWPEHCSVQIDIFTCGNHEKARKAYEVLKTIFKPGKISEKVLLRKLDSIKEDI